MPKRRKPVKEEDLTDRKVWELLRKASTLELNIYDDLNNIIKVLCKALLRERGKDPSVDPDRR